MGTNRVAARFSGREILVMLKEKVITKFKLKNKLKKKLRRNYFEKTKFSLINNQKH